MAKIEAILDAGPLIHLAELDALDALDDFDLRVPDAVLIEVASHQPYALEKLGGKLQRVLTPQLPPDLQILAQSLSLDRGEVEALGLMMANPHAWFLTDDAAARLVAEQRGYRVHGTIGLLIRMVRRGQRTPRSVVELLRAIPERSSLFIRPSLLNDIIQRLEQEWQLA